MNDLSADARVVGLLEKIAAEQRRAGDAQAAAQALHASTLAAQHAFTRQAVRWFGAFILAFGAIAALGVAWPSLAWLLSG